MAESTTLREEAPVVSTNPNANANNNNNNSSAVVEDATTSGSSTGTSTSLSLEEKDLKQLARQVEYYFSTANLAKDMYVATLRSLNDGYVPLSILANFGKVRAIACLDGIEAVRKAATDYSDLLEVVCINTSTGMRVRAASNEGEEDDPSSTTTLTLLEAVGPINGEPIQLTTLTTESAIAAIAAAAIAQQSPVAVAAPSSVRNTVILREVPEDVTEEQVRALFNFETCPSIKSLHLDVANCW